jgi:hypothetical protein
MEGREGKIFYVWFKREEGRGGILIKYMFGS